MMRFLALRSCWTLMPIRTERSLPSPLETTVTSRHQSWLESRLHRIPSTPSESEPTHSTRTIASHALRTVASGQAAKVQKSNPTLSHPARVPLDHSLFAPQKGKEHSLPGRALHRP